MGLALKGLRAQVPHFWTIFLLYTPLKITERDHWPFTEFRRKVLSALEIAPDIGYCLAENSLKVKKSQLIRQINILFQRLFQALMMKKLSYKNYNKRNTARDSCNVQSHDQEESKLNSTISADSVAHTLKNDQWYRKSPFNKNNVETVKSK